MIMYRRVTDIQAMTFDLDDTLYDNMPYIYQAERALTNHIKTRYPAAARLSKEIWLACKQQAISNEPMLKYDMGLLRLATLRNGFAQCEYSLAEAEHAAQDCFAYFYQQRSLFTVTQPYCDVLAQLSQRMPLIAITNGNVDVAAIGIGQYFTAVYRADMAHRAKPYADMFDKAQAALDIPAQNILHVGDDLRNDVYGAYLNGYKSAWYAADRSMSLQHEPVTCLPDVQLSHFSDLLNWA